jgi:hypothetical protein
MKEMVNSQFVRKGRKKTRERERDNYVIEGMRENTTENKSKDGKCFLFLSPPPPLSLSLSLSLFLHLSPFILLYFRKRDCTRSNGRFDLVHISSLKLVDLNYFWDGINPPKPLSYFIYFPNKGKLNLDLLVSKRSGSGQTPKRPKCK